MAHDVCQINGPGDLDLEIVGGVGNLRSEFRHARPSGSPVIRYVRDRRTDRQKQRLLSSFLWAGHNNFTHFYSASDMVRTSEALGKGVR